MHGKERILRITSLGVCVFFISRPATCADQAGGAQSILPEQRRLFPADHATPLLHLDWGVRQRHREEQGLALEGLWDDEE